MAAPRRQMWAGGLSEHSFLGMTLNAVDAKNRVSIPASIRELLGHRGDARSVVLAPAERADCLVGYDPGYTAKKEAELDARFVGAFTDERDDIFRMTFGGAEQVAIDDNGRIILSAALQDVGAIDRLALFVGAGRYFEVWNPHNYVARPTLNPRLARMVQRLIDARGAG